KKPTINIDIAIINVPIIIATECARLCFIIFALFFTVIGVVLGTQIHLDMSTYNHSNKKMLDQYQLSEFEYSIHHHRCHKRWTHSWFLLLELLVANLTICTP